MEMVEEAKYKKKEIKKEEPQEEQNATIES